MTHSLAWDQVTHAHVVRAIQEYDRLGPERFFSEHGFAPTTTYDLVWDERRYPPKAILGTAYEFATGQRLASGDFEGGKTGAVKVLGKLGFTIHPRRPALKVTSTRAGARHSGAGRLLTQSPGRCTSQSVDGRSTGCPKTMLAWCWRTVPGLMDRAGAR